MLNKKNGPRKKNPFFHLVMARGLTLTAEFQEKIIMEVGGKKIEIFLMEVGSNQAAIKFVCDKDVAIYRKNFVNDEEKNFSRKEAK